MRELTIHQLLEDAVDKFPDAEIVSGNLRFTYVEFRHRVLKLANKLAQMGLVKGTVAGIMDVNSHRYLELQYALSYLGAIVHTVNFRLSQNHLQYTISHAKDSWLFVWEGFGDVVSKLASLVPHFVVLKENASILDSSFMTYESLIEAGSPEIPASAKDVHESDTYSIFYTTGTTGKPKGVRYRHRDILLASTQIAHHLALYETGAKLEQRDTIMPLIPFFHIHGWGTAFFGLYLGAKIVLPEKADATAQVELIHRESVSWCNMVPTQLHILLDVGNQTHKGLSLKVLTGGSALPSGLAKRAAESGIQFSLIYGGSDQLAAGISGYTNGQLPKATVPIPMVHVKILDKAGNAVVKDDSTIGELWVQSPWLPDGYVGDEEQSRQVFLDGWFRTSDLAVHMEDGSFLVVDRVKDAIKSGGEWIATAVIENIASELAGVSMVAVIAVSDERWGERPLAIVEANAFITEQMIREHMEKAVQLGKLAKYWLPIRYEFISDMLLTSAGKIDKVALRKKFVVE